ncbi:MULTISPECIES: DUF421 domain-containing protein [Limosilactobacillus]|jgi:uncharacterized membrane protein YcaP (DUF421 family)|uniref:DUF421 domain-containing protein n=1 Tax=Limosilactobacillus TaxID=2742598 RepID=UPI002246B35B|nr:DUF421 domain-containing protein [Limosilactobacillus pontis]MCX2186170.1 DUF421 domain-containing protein [Limosilactobacillus pontis]MCX2187856.1 DUF421 domain-containing protein [Limosilactobacillus pontis]
MDYGLVTIKFILGMLCLILQINILGKGNLAPTTAIDQVQNYVLGGIIGGIIYNNDITVLQFIMVLLIWTLIVFVVKFTKEHNYLVQKVVDGQPRLLIRNGQVLVDNCIRAGISANDLMFKLRSRGIYEVSKVKSGILEQNGQLVVIENDEENIRFPLINDGRINQDVLELIHHDEAWVEQQVRQAGYAEIGDIFLGEYIHGQVHLVAYPKR